MFLKQIPPPELADQSDEYLVKCFRQTGEHHFFAELFDRYVHLVYFMTYRYLDNQEDRRDLVMRVFEKVLTELPRTKRLKSFNNWLHSLVRNECLNYQRQGFREGNFKRALKEDPHWVKEPVAPGSLLEGSPEVDPVFLLEEVLPCLKKEQYHCIYLFFFEGKSYKEIAMETGYALGQVKSYLQNGKRRLKHMLLKKSR